LKIGLLTHILLLFQFHKKFSKFYFTGPARGGVVKDTQIPGIVWSDANIPKLGGDPDRYQIPKIMISTRSQIPIIKLS
jgi:hypothetical protein